MECRLFVKFRVFPLSDDVLEVLARERGFRRIGVSAERETGVSGEHFRFITMRRLRILRDERFELLGGFRVITLTVLIERGGEERVFRLRRRSGLRRLRSLRKNGEARRFKRRRNDEERGGQRGSEGKSRRREARESTAFRRTSRKNVQNGKGAHKAVFRLLSMRKI